MDDKTKIEELKKQLIASEAQNLHYYKQTHEGETRSWDDLPAEEQEARIWYAEYILKGEHPELFA